MPLVRIELPKGKPPQHRRAIADIVYATMLEVMKVPQGDRFQIIAEHRGRTIFIIDPSTPRRRQKRGGDHHPDHAQRGAFARTETSLLQSARRPPARGRGPAPRRRVRQPRRSEKGKLVLRRRRRAICVSGAGWGVALGARPSPASRGRTNATHSPWEGGLRVSKGRNERTAKLGGDRSAAAPARRTRGTRKPCRAPGATHGPPGRRAGGGRTGNTRSP